jgi:hypothetical protein
MGFFDLFRRKASRDELDAYLEANKPRAQYYLFAHGALRELALEQPMMAFAGVLSDEPRDKTGRMLWDDCGQRVKQAGEPTWPFPGMESRMYDDGPFPMAVVKLPEAKKQTEAHFVAIVLCVDPKKDKPPPPVPARYFTLEHGGPGGETVFGEWTKDGKHLNRGEGPAAEWEPFHRAVLEQFAQVQA